MFSVKIIIWPLSVLLPLLARTVWRHKRKDSTNLKQHWNQPFPPVHLRYCSLAHMYLFRIFLLSFRGWFDVIYAGPYQSQDSIGTNHFYRIIFDTVLLLTDASSKLAILQLHWLKRHKWTIKEINSFLNLFYFFQHTSIRRSFHHKQRHNIQLYHKLSNLKIIYTIIKHFQQISDLYNFGLAIILPPLPLPLPLPLAFFFLTYSFTIFVFSSSNFSFITVLSWAFLMMSMFSSPVSRCSLKVFLLVFWLLSLCGVGERSWNDILSVNI